MKERKINIGKVEDKTLVVDNDGKMIEELSKIYQDMQLNLGHCYDQLKKGKLSEGMKEVHLSLAESNMIKFLKQMNYDSILEKEEKERYSEIKGLNEENRELRKQLGQKVSNEDAREKMKNIGSAFTEWWNINGFGHSSDSCFSSSGYFECRLSGMITRAYYKDGKATKDQKITYLKELGFSISKEKYIIANDSNFNLLEKLIKDNFPSFFIKRYEFTEWENQREIKDVHLVIRNLDEIID